jgi:predicted Ser/Thr protein kinase
MNADIRRRAGSVFSQAIERQPESREAFIHDACGGDPDLLAAVRVMLDSALKERVPQNPALSPRGEFTLDLRHTMTVAPSLSGELAAPQSNATVIGRYRVIRVIGEGGMGTVYEAQQDHPRRTVALKVIKPGMTSPALLRRFEHEAEALGRLQHQGIAQIYEAGTAVTGSGQQPYFAMEFIRGESLRDYADRTHINTRQRLELMAKVCDAVHHAHQRGLIHRDLKPGNILVDETGQPKILDFGVARLTDRDAQSTSQTDLGQLIGTLAYMSPEQVLADPLELDTRSDVYALGVILYELLAARLPYTIGNKLHEALHAIREEDPAKLSSVNRSYRGDIETIAAKALEKDKSRRYSSSAELAADIRRYLTDEPIVARPPSLSYQLQKFAGRHRTLVAGLVAVFVVLIGGIIASTLQAQRANRERDRATAAEQKANQARDQATAAEQRATRDRDLAIASDARAREQRDKAVEQQKRADTEAATSKAVSTFWQQNLIAQARDGDLSMRAALDQAAAKIKDSIKDPFVEANVRESVAQAYITLSALREAQRELNRALELRRRVQGDDNPDTLHAMTVLAGTYAGRSGEAETILKKVYDTGRAKLGEDHPVVMESMSALADVYMAEKKFSNQQAVLTKLIATQRRKLGPESRDTLLSAFMLATSYLGSETPEGTEQAIRILKELVPAASRALGESDRVTQMARGLFNVANVAARFQATKSQPTPSQMAEMMTDVSGRLSKTEFSTLPQMLAATEVEVQPLLLQGKFAEAINAVNNRFEMVRRAGVENDPLTAVLWRYLGQADAGVKKYPEAKAAYLKGISLVQSARMSDPALLLTFKRLLASVHQTMREYSEAESLYREIVDAEERNPGEGDQQTRIDIGFLAQVYNGDRKYKEAADAFNRLLQAQRRYVGPETLNSLITATTVGWLRVQLEQYAEAEMIVRETEAVLERTAPDSWERYNAKSLLGVILAAEGKYPEAESLLIDGYKGTAERQPALRSGISLFTSDNAGAAIVKMYQDSGNPDRAAEWQAKLQNNAKPATAQ